MTARHRALWTVSLVPWAVAALVWSVLQVGKPPADPEPVGSPPAASGPAPRVSGVVDTRDDPATTVVADRGPDWAAILDRLDNRRERAYALRDPSRLRSVYVTGSEVLRHDMAVLLAYRERGVRLTGVRLRVLDTRLVGRDGPYARLRVVDRLDRPTAHTLNGSVRMPRDRATDRLIVLRDGAHGWRIAAVRPV
jgi:hypothetical protein